MATEAITLELDSAAVRAIEAASKQDRDKMALLLGNWVLEYARANVASLKDTMDEMSAKARERGLTPEVLESILESE